MPFRSLTKRQMGWLRRWLAVLLLGVLVFVIGLSPDVVGMDRSRVIGFIQMGVWLTGLGLALLGAFLAVHVVRNGRPMSLRAEIGTRLLATGYVVSATATLADFLSIGSHRLPWVYFGPLQGWGLVSGVILSLIGLFLYWPRTPKSQPESLPA